MARFEAPRAGEPAAPALRFLHLGAHPLQQRELAVEGPLEDLDRVLSRPDQERPGDDPRRPPPKSAEDARRRCGSDHPAADARPGDSKSLAWQKLELRRRRGGGQRKADQSPAEESRQTPAHRPHGRRASGARAR